jgi:hypothetical protein
MVFISASRSLAFAEATSDKSRRVTPEAASNKLSDEKSPEHLNIVATRRNPGCSIQVALRAKLQITANAAAYDGTAATTPSRRTEDWVRREQKMIC